MYFVFDIGGTKMRMAHSVDGVHLSNVRIIKTPFDFESAVPHLETYLRECKAGGRDLISCGLPGVLDYQNEFLVGAGHLPLWVNKPIKKVLTDISGASVFLENDAAMAALGESVFGAGREKAIVGFLTFGTGVGGARVVNRKIDLSFLGFEPGHQIIDADGTIAGMNQTLDSLVGGAGIYKRFGKKGEEIRDPHVWMEIERLMAIGVVNTTVHWSPEILVLGGSLMENEFISIAGIKKFAEGFLKIANILPEMKRGVLGDHAGLFGGLAFLGRKV